MEKIPLIAVVGPTASGKTKVSIELAKRLDGEIVSCDSMQIYKNMNIATAKPSQEEMQGIKHHLIGFLDCDKDFNVAQYVGLAHAIIESIHARGKVPILVGGTGLYYNSLVSNLTFSDAESDPKLRKQLEEYAKKSGNEALHNKLAQIDPKAAQQIHPNNVIRVIRAIESFEMTGKTMEENVALSKMKTSNYNLCAVGLNYNNRQDLYERINLRVDIMMHNGLLKEAKEIYDKHLLSTGAQAIGYKELFSYFNGECTLAQAIIQLKMQSRRYAKRQLTWFLRDERINWVNIESGMEFAQVMEQVNKIIDCFNNIC